MSDSDTIDEVDSEPTMACVAGLNDNWHGGHFQSSTLHIHEFASGYQLKYQEIYILLKLIVVFYSNLLTFAFCVHVSGSHKLCELLFSNINVLKMSGEKSKYN